MKSNWRPLLQGPLADRALRTVREIADALEASGIEGRTAFQASLAGGQSGQALFYAYLALQCSDDALADRAAELLDRAADELASTPMSPSFYSGFPGVAWTMEHLQGRLFEAADDGEGEQEDPFLEIDEALLGPLERSPARITPRRTSSKPWPRNSGKACSKGLPRISLPPTTSRSHVNTIPSCSSMSW